MSIDPISDFNMLQPPDKCGAEMYAWAKDLFPICRSLTGQGVRKTLEYFRNIVPELNIHEIPSGTKVLDWTIPDEWNIKSAYIEDSKGNRIIDFDENNLHVVGYSIPVNKCMTLDQLQNHLHSLPDQPTAIPYITSYYKENWGFCLSHNQRRLLKDDNYQVFIDSQLEAGSMTYADLILPGESSDEILITSYICHPSMANNELSGPVLAIALARWLSTVTKRKYTYRFVLAPETIGSVAYLSQHIDYLKKHTLAGFVLSCVGDNNAYTMIRSRNGKSLADKVAKHVLKHIAPDHVDHSFLKRGSDERNYCAPGIDLPVVVLSRTRYGDYPGYHTSLDNLDIISDEGFDGAYTYASEIIRLLEANNIFKTAVLGEPQLGKRGLYPEISTKKINQDVVLMTNFLAYADGTRDLIELADQIDSYAGDCGPTANSLYKKGLIKILSCATVSG